MRKKVYGIIIFACLVLLCINIASIIWAVHNNQSINITDVISIVVTIILGISTILQSEQENRNSKQGLELDIKSHTPYYIIKSLIEDANHVNGYEITNAQRVDTSLFENDLYKEKKVFALVGYKRNTENNARILVDLCLRNSSETLLSEIKIQLFDNDSKQWVDNQYKNPVREFLDTTVKNNVQETYNDIMEQHYNELFCDEYSNIQPAEDFVINLDMSNKHIEYPVENIIKSGYTPEALFFKIKIVSRSIYDELFEQEIELGLRLFAGMKGVKPNKYNLQTYDSWQIYEVLKIKTKAICNK